MVGVIDSRLVTALRAVRLAAALGLASAGLALVPQPASAETGMMSHYSGLSVTASGRSYSSGDSVAAHKTLPLGTMVRVENLRNGRSATVKIVDRGPYVSGRIIDVSVGVANNLGFTGQGVAPTRITVIGRGSSAGPYDRGGRAVASSNDDDDTPKARAKKRTVKVASYDDDDAPKQSVRSRKIRLASLDDDQPRRKPARVSRRVQKEEDDD